MRHVSLIIEDFVNILYNSVCDVISIGLLDRRSKAWEHLFSHHQMLQMSDGDRLRFQDEGTENAQ